MSDADFDAPTPPKPRPSKPKHATIEGTAAPTAKPAPAPALSPEAQEIANIIEHSPALVLTDPEKLAAVCKQMETELAEFVPDLTTDKGRKAVAAFAFKFAKSKTAIDDAGKALNAELRKKIDAVDEVRREIREKFDGYRDQARKPLDEWEAERERRQNARNAFFEALQLADRLDPLDTSADILAKIEAAQALVPTLVGFGEEGLQSAIERRNHVIDALREQAKHVAIREAEQAELVRLRLEREELVARETKRLAEDQARRDAEAAAAAAEERKRREKAAAAEQVRIAEQRARDEEAAKARRQQEQQAREHQAEIDRLKRIEDERIAREQREEEERIARERDQQNRRAKMTAAKLAIMEAGEITEDQAREIVIAIVGNTIPNVKMEF
jgi:colicin import membrane protein